MAEVSMSSIHRLINTAARTVTSSRIGLLLIAALLLGSVLSKHAGTATASASAANATIAAKWHKIYTFESDANGFNTKTYFYDTGREVVAFDTQFTPELAQQSISYLRTKTANPISYVVVTHPNPDKFNGMSVFQKQGAKVIASRATVAALPGVHEYKKYYFVQIARMFTEETYPKLGSVDIVFDQQYTLTLRGGATVALQTLAQPGVSSTQTIASIPALRALLVGDLIHHRAHAWLEGGIVNGQATPKIAQWQANLKALKAQFAHQPGTVVYGGRGKAAKLAKAVDEQIAYLHKADAIVTRYIERLGDRKSELQGSEAGKHYELLQQEFEAAFPSYEFGYMIKFGVYGLVNSKL
jgi:glyoxylase-like metal-dependent hydrolase (beta-lactamase superfamily II)